MNFWFARPWRCLAGPLAWLGLSAAAVAQQGELVDLELVLAVDLSSSVDQGEFDLQMHGLSEAFRHPELLEAIQAAGGNGIAVAVVQWSDHTNQSLAVPWTLVRDARAATALARGIRQTRRQVGGGQTGIGGAMAFAMAQFENNGFRSWRKTIDLSGDGRANSGTPPMRVRDRAVAAGMVVNGLAIVNEEPFVDRYYRDSVIGGPGAFMMVAQDYQDFAVAILRKLIREIGPPLAGAPQSHPTALAAID